MTELLLFAVTAAAAGILLRPFLRRGRLPGWLGRARQRGRPGIPVSAWLAAAAVMALCWLLGERRGITGLLLWLLWTGAPLVAAGVTILWLRRPDTA